MERRQPYDKNSRMQISIVQVRDVGIVKSRVAEETQKKKKRQLEDEEKNLSMN
jgi:hypothetical protein